MLTILSVIRKSFQCKRRFSLVLCNKFLTDSNLFQKWNWFIKIVYKVLHKRGCLLYLQLCNVDSKIDSYLLKLYKPKGFWTFFNRLELKHVKMVLPMAVGISKLTSGFILSQCRLFFDPNADYLPEMLMFTYIWVLLWWFLSRWRASRFRSLFRSRGYRWVPLLYRRTSSVSESPLPTRHLGQSWW